MILYTGDDTKIMMNSGDYHFKMSRMESIINKCILFNIGLLLCINFIFLIQNYYWLTDNEDKISSYIYPDGDINYGQTTFYLFFSMFLIMNNFVPLALVVT